MSVCSFACRLCKCSIYFQNMTLVGVFFVIICFASKFSPNLLLCFCIFSLCLPGRAMSYQKARFLVQWRRGYALQVQNYFTKFAE